jgi:hypothetical protein
MKTRLTFYIVSLFISAISFAQTSENSKISQLIVGGNHNFQLVGEDSKTLIDSLFAHYPKTKRKGYVWKFKNVEIPELDNSFTFQVHQGLYGEEVNNGCDTTKCKNGFYFTTFVSEKYKQHRLANKKATEQDAILIYVKNGRKYGASTKEDAEFVKAFLLAILES